MKGKKHKSLFLLIIRRPRSLSAHFAEVRWCSTNVFPPPHLVKNRTFLLFIYRVENAFGFVHVWFGAHPCIKKTPLSVSLFLSQLVPST